MQTKMLTQEADFLSGPREKLLLFLFNKALEIRGYLKSCGADINEESMSPLHEDLEQLLMACDINFKSEAGMCLKFLIIRQVWYLKEIIMKVIFTVMNTS